MWASLPFHEWSSLRTELIWIYDRAVPPGSRQWKGKGREMPGYRAWLIRRGSVRIQTRTERYTVEAGHWIMPLRTATETRFSDDAHLLSIHFLCQWPSGENLLEGREGLGFKAETYPDLERLAVELHDSLQRQFPRRDEPAHVYSQRSSNYLDFLRSHGRFLAWLAVWFQIQVENGARLSRLTSGDSRPFHAARCLNLAPLHRGFPAEELQRETSLGLMRLNQLFFSEFGLTTRKYWDRRRLEFARQCLETSRMPLKEIAFRLGFRSDSHFTVWFRRLASVRPGEYRRSGGVV